MCLTKIHSPKLSWIPHAGKGFAALIALQTSLGAVVLTDPTLGSEIDPAGGAEVDAAASGSTPQATLEGITDFAVLQDFTGFQASNVGDNIVNFTGGTYSDILFVASGSASSNSHGDVQTSSTLSTSLDEYIQMRNNSGSSRTLSYNIYFGNYDSGSSTFTPDVNPVTAAGFTLTNVTATSSSGATVDFYNTEGSIVSTQSVDNALDNIYFGYDNGTEGIARIRIRTFRDSGISTVGFDDLGFSPTTVPEPGATAACLAALAGIGAWVRRRRQRA